MASSNNFSRSSYGIILMMLLERYCRNDVKIGHYDS